MKTTQIYSQAVVALMLWASITEMNAEPFLYVSNGAGSQLVRVDVGAGTTTAIGLFGEPWCSAIAITPQGALYTVAQGWPPGSPNPQLASVDATTGDATPFGANLSPEIFMGIGFSPEGKLYGVNADSGTADAGSLYRFDPETGAATKVKVTGSCGSIMDLAWHPDGTMYGADPSSLYQINPNTGEAKKVVTTGRTRIMGLAIDDDGNFYVSEIVANAPLLRLDPATGATTPVPGVTLNFPHGLEFIPTPRTRPVALAFEKSPVTSEHWLGSVDTDFDGASNGDLLYDQVPGSRRSSGKTVHFEGVYAVETDFYAFTARLEAVLNRSNGSITGNGVITEGWLSGSQLHLDAESASDGVRGLMRILPGSAD